MADSEKDQLLRRLLRLTPEFRVLERMRHHGFWPSGQGLPPDPPEEIAERDALQKEADELARVKERIQDPEKALDVERKRRWEESKKRRAEKKAQREAEQKARREEWETRRRGLLAHAGSGVSAGLEARESDIPALSRLGLPLLHTAEDVAQALDVTLSRLRWLTFHRRGATLVHYHRFQIPKKSGGMRAISAPKRALADAQQWIRLQLLERVEPGPHAHGFVRARSIVTNAIPHVGRAVVINMDLQDFFPTLTFRRVKGLFSSFGYSEQVATVLALLCTEPPRLAVQLAGSDKVLHVALGERVLPQGACTSPAITNLVCRRLDRRLSGLARHCDFTFTRYADDLTFSGDDPERVGFLLRRVRGILLEEGLREHPQKTRVMRTGRRQEVTGVTVNRKPAAARDYVRELRAILHNAARHGLASQNRENHPDFAAYLRGRVEFVCMVDPARRPALMPALARALHGA